MTFWRVSPVFAARVVAEPGSASADEQPGPDRVQRGLGRGGVVDDGDVVHGPTFPPTIIFVKTISLFGRTEPSRCRNTLAGVPPAEAEISSWIAEWARRTPDTVAIRFEDQAITYAALEQRVARLAGALGGRGAVAAGDRVAYLGHNAPELLDLLFACARLGAILVPLSARMPAAELEVVLANTEPATLFAQDAFVATAREARGLAAASRSSASRICRCCSPSRPTGAGIPIDRCRRRWRSSTRRAPPGRRRAPC